MNQHPSLLRLATRRLLQTTIAALPTQRLKCALRAALLRHKDGLHESLLCEPGETVVMVGVHRIDTAMNWSSACGAQGKVVLVEAVPRYLENIRANLENHFNWPLANIVYVASGVAAAPGVAQIEVGQRADYNKLAGMGIDDRLPDDAFITKEEIPVDSIDNILQRVGVAPNHITQTISGMEMQALAGMAQTLLRPGLRLLIRSLHMIDDRPVYAEAARHLQQLGFEVALGRQVTACGGRNVFAFRP